MHPGAPEKVESKWSPPPRRGPTPGEDPSVGQNEERQETPKAREELLRVSQADLEGRLPDHT